MKITKEYLKQIIKEELDELSQKENLEEGWFKNAMLGGAALAASLTPVTAKASPNKPAISVSNDSKTTLGADIPKNLKQEYNCYLINKICCLKYQFFFLKAGVAQR